MENIAGDKMFAHVERALNDRRPITADIFLTNTGWRHTIFTMELIQISMRCST